MDIGYVVCMGSLAADRWIGLDCTVLVWNLQMNASAACVAACVHAMDLRDGQQRSIIAECRAQGVVGRAESAEYRTWLTAPRSFIWTAEAMQSRNTVFVQRSCTDQHLKRHTFQLQERGISEVLTASPTQTQQLR